MAAVAIAANLASPKGSGANSLAAALDRLPQTGAVAALEQEQRQIAIMNAATTVLTSASKPVVVSPARVENRVAQQQAAQQAAQQQAAQQQAAQQAAQAAAQQQQAAQESAQTQDTVPSAPADPSAAEATGERLMLADGFASSQWSCLYDLWERESGWNVYAENPSSGAYGIPQAYPGSKMASAGANWQTSATTQIEWGLSYISSTYGTPCNAYNFDVANGGY